MQHSATIEAGASERLNAVLNTVQNRWCRKFLRHDDVFRLYNTLDNEVFLNAGQPPYSILVASSQSGEGATSIAVMYAALTAVFEPDRRMLLVDADLFATKKDSLLGLAGPKPGLGEYMRGTTEFDGAVQRSMLDNLHVVRNRQPGPDRIKFANRAFTTFMDEARRRYDLVVVDAPPARRSHDAVAMSRTVGHVIVVCRYGGPNREQVQVMLDRMKDAGANVLGAVLNQRIYPIPRLLYGLR